MNHKDIVEQPATSRLRPPIDVFNALFADGFSAVAFSRTPHGSATEQVVCDGSGAPVQLCKSD